MASILGIQPVLLADATGGSIVVSSGLDPDALVDDIIEGIEDAFENYTTVGLDGSEGMPGVGVSVVAVGDDAVGAGFVGTYDRSIDRAFEFDVTFTGLAEGTHEFLTYALVNGRRVASEEDSITVGNIVPEPGTMLLFGFGLLGLVGATRRKR